MIPGVYNAEIIAVGLGVSSAGNPNVWITAAVDDGFGKTEDMTGHIYLTARAMGMARGQFKAIGFDYRQFDLNRENLQRVIGHSVEVTLEEQTFGNRRELRIAKFGANHPPSPESLAAATAALRSGKDEGSPAPSPDDAEAKRDRNLREQARDEVRPPLPMEPEIYEDGADDIPF
jgi:hypothetical protein